MTLGALSQRLRRADFLDGLGIYVGTQEVALAYVTKRLFSVTLRHARTFPLPAATHPIERRQALGQAVLTFAREHRVDTRRAYLCLPRSRVLLNRVLLPAAAQENLDQVLEYEMDHLIPVPRDQLYFDYSHRQVSEDRLEVLLLCVARTVVQEHLDALEDAFVRPRGIVLASTAIADYLAFCRGDEERSTPMGLVIGSGEGVELALLAEGQLVASEFVPASRVRGPGDVSRPLARQLADGLVDAEATQLYRWELANGSGPGLPVMGDDDLPALAAGRLEAPAEFFESREAAILPALGAALDAVREGVVPLNLLPIEGRRLHEEGPSITTLVVLALLAVLLVGWGASALVKDGLLRAETRRQIAAVAPQVQAVKALQDEIAGLRRQLDVIAPGRQRRVTSLLRELSEIVPADAYLTTISLRGDRLTLDGYARSASDLIPALEKSKQFRNVTFTSPTTKTGDKERFSLVAEAER